MRRQPCPGLFLSCIRPVRVNSLPSYIEERPLSQPPMYHSPEPPPSYLEDRPSRMSSES